MKKISTATFVASMMIIGAVSVFAWTGVHALWYAPETEVAPSPAVSQSLPSVDSGDYPIRLSIPTLDIDAHVQRVGINGKGTMAIPSNFKDVAWYKYGPVPGVMGSAVIDGHVDNGLGLDGVFKHLNEIQIGDDLYVDTESGKRLHFVVRNVKSYPYKDVPIDQLFMKADAKRLNLVTCEGAWVKGDKTYDHRLVVYTELEES